MTDMKKEYIIPQLCPVDICAQGLICDSFSAPELVEEDIDVIWEPDDTNN